MYGGSLVEVGPLDVIMRQAQHPYTQALQQCRPQRGQAARHQALRVIDGQPPVLTAMPKGCVFHPRCEQAMSICAQQAPPLHANYRCWLSQREPQGEPAC